MDNSLTPCAICGFQPYSKFSKLNHIHRKHKIRIAEYSEKYEKMELAAESNAKAVARIAATWDKSETITCRLCNKICKNATGLGAHIVGAHEDWTVEAYHLHFDYERVKNENDLRESLYKTECKICGHLCKNMVGFGSHMRYKHPNFSPKKYYDSFLKKESDGKCRNCDTETEFGGRCHDGYKLYCSKECKYEYQQRNYHMRNLAARDGTRSYAYKMQSYTTKNGNEVFYQSRPELEFIKRCEDENICILNGDLVPYYLDGAFKMYHVDFLISKDNKKRLVEIKSSHMWYYEDLESGKLEAKRLAAEKWSEDHNYMPFLFLLDGKFEKFLI